LTNYANRNKWQIRIRVLPQFGRNFINFAKTKRYQNGFTSKTKRITTVFGKESGEF